MTSSADRRTILSRRAAFVGTALATLGACSRGSGQADAPEPAPAPSAAVVEVAAPPADAEPAPEALPEAGPPGQVSGGAPPLDVPADVSPEAKKRFEQLATKMRGVYARFDRIDVPKDCELTDASCDARWRKLADDLLELDDSSRYIIPVCKGSSESARRFGERAAQHAEHVAQLRKKLDEQIASVVAGGGAKAKTRWQEHRQDASRARPRVCLSFACGDW